MAQKNTDKAERVTLVHATRGTRITVGAALASRMSGYKRAKSGPAAEADDGTPSESWTATRLKAYAAANDIDLDGVTRKADILDAIAAAADPDNDANGQDDEDDDLDGQDDDEE
jgi:hypothetical protein